jgi:hypothetical protein
MPGVKPAGVMRTPSRTVALKLGILAVGATASIILTSACKKSLILPTNERPILIIFDAGGVKTTKTAHEVQDECSKLNGSGKGLCEIDYYNEKGEKVFHETPSLTMTRAVRSEAAGNPASADPANLTQKVAVDTLDTATDFLGKIK